MPKLQKIQVEFEGRWREEEAIVEEDPLSPWKQDASLIHVGQPVQRVDGYERVSGRATYTCDVILPGMLYGKILRCPHPHARITRIDSSRAEALEGVFAVMTLENAPPIAFEGDRRLFEEELRYQGEEVAAVVADDEYTAVDALALIDVEYEILPHVVDLEAALAPDAPQVQPGGNLLLGTRDIYQRGDLDAGFASADVIVEATYHTPTALHNSLETHGSVAQWINGKLTVWDSTQGVFNVRKSLAKALDLPFHRIRVIKQYMGGGFGSKLSMGKYTLLAALLSRSTARPVRFLLDRREENLCTGNRPSALIQCKVGAKKDGSLTALWSKSLSAVGAYGGKAGACGGPFRDMYLCANVHTEEGAVHTHTGPACAFRAPGYVEGTFALESLMDELAHELQMDPLQLRLHNYADSNQSRNLPYTSKTLRQAYELGAAAIGWNKRNRKAGDRSGRFRQGIGMASQTWGGGGTPPYYAIVKLNPDLTADVLTGTQDLGTGTKTVVAQIAAEELGLRVEDIRVILGDTESGPFGESSGGSITMASVGPAVRLAAYDAKRQVLELAGFILDTPPERLDIRERVVASLDDPNKMLPLSEVAAKTGNYTIIGRGARGPNPRDATINTFGAQFAQVEVDMDTGQLRVLQIVGKHDVGRALNPLTLSSQFEGGVLQAIGFATMEARLVDTPTGMVLNANLEDYKLPTVLDTPQIDVTAVDLADPVCNSLGAKGAGEPPIIPSAAAIANAVYHATGLRIRTLPLTPQVILEAIALARDASDKGGSQ